jgi:hypothetical protein
MFRSAASARIYSQSARIRVFILFVLLLLVPLFAYFSLHVTKRTAYFNDRNFRQLNNFSRQIADRIDSLRPVIITLGYKVLKETGQKDDTNDDVDYASEKSNQTLQGYLNLLRNEGTNLTQPAAVERGVSGSGKYDGPQLTLQVVNEGDKSLLRYEYFGKPEVDLYGADPFLDVDRVKAATLRFYTSTDFKQFIETIVGTAVDAGNANTSNGRQFDDLLIARADTGKVLFEQTHGDLSLTSLESVALADTPDKAFDFKARSKTSEAVDVTIAGTRYKLYAQPISIALQTKGSENAESLWVICGLVEASRFRYQTWAVSYIILIVCAFIAGLLLLSWPFLKLIFIGPKDRVRMVEVYILAAAIIITGSLLTFFILFGVSYWQLENELDNQLSALSDNFQTNFDTELSSALTELDKLDCQHYVTGLMPYTCKDGHCSDSVFQNLDGKCKEWSAGILNKVCQGDTCRPVKQVTSEETDADEDPFAERTRILSSICPRGKCDSDPYPYFKTAFWLDILGRQRAKWTVSMQTTPLVSVRNRDYFRKLREGSYYDVRKTKFQIEPINSMNTGGFSVVISRDARRLPQGIRHSSSDPLVVALETNLMSLMTPAVLGGFDYRVIDGNGNVVFPQAKENFFAECANDHHLRSAASGHLNDFVDVSYLGEDARVYISPLRGFPDWSLVVLRDKEPVRSSYLEVVALSSSLFLVYLLPFLVILVLMFLISLFTGKRLAWICPASYYSPVYLQLIPIYIVLTLIGYELSNRLSDRASLILLSLLSVVSLLFMLVQLKFRIMLKPSVRLARYLEGRWTFADHRLLYPLCLVGLVFVIAVLPSLAFFRLVHNEQMDLFIRYGQTTLVNSLNERESRLRSTYRFPTLRTKTDLTTFIDDRLGKDLDRYYKFFFGTQINDTTTTQPVAPDNTRENLIQRLSKLLPFASQSSIVRHGLMASHSADNRWLSYVDANGKMAFSAPAGTTGGEKFYNIASDTRHFRLNAWALLIFLGLIIPALFLLIRFVVNRVFLVDAVKPVRPRAISIFANDGKLFMVLGSPFTRRDSLLKTENFKVVRLKSSDGSDSILEKLDAETLKNEGRIAIDDFEYQIDQPQANLKKLSLLERLVSQPGALAIISTAEPSDYSFDGVEGTSGSGSGNARWANVMSKLNVHYEEDNGDPAAFNAELDQIRSANEDEKAGITTDEEKVDLLFELLERECAPRACLQDIGISIARRPDFKVSNLNEVFEEILLQSGTYYNSLWNSCSPGEKLTLAHLASDSFLSANDPDITRLVRRGLIIRDPDVRLMNESFRVFVLAKSRTDKDVEITEGQARKTSSWQYLKVVLSAIVIVIMVFLFATQRDLYNSTLIFLTSIVAGVPAIFNFFSLFQKSTAKTAT